MSDDQPGVLVPIRLLQQLVDSVRRAPEETAQAIRRALTAAEGRRSTALAAPEAPRPDGLVDQAPGGPSDGRGPAPPPGAAEYAWPWQGGRQFSPAQLRARSFSVFTPRGPSGRARDIYGATTGLLGALGGTSPELGLGHWAAMMAQGRRLADSWRSFRRTWSAAGRRRPPRYPQPPPAGRRRPAGPDRPGPGHRVPPPGPAPQVIYPRPVRPGLEEPPIDAEFRVLRPGPPLPGPGRSGPEEGPRALPLQLLEHRGPTAGAPTGLGQAPVALPAAPAPLALGGAPGGQGVMQQVVQLWQEILREQRALRAAVEKWGQGREDETAENDRGSQGGEGQQGASMWEGAEAPGQQGQPPAARPRQKAPSTTSTAARMAQTVKTGLEIAKWAAAAAS